MTITIEKRDLFTVPQGYYLAHCISADFALGAGIAKKFDEVYNMRFKLFREYDMYEYEGGDALLIDNVFNLVTKKKCYHKPTYESIEAALETMKDIMDFNSTTKLAMPKIGCGLDKCEWDTVYDIICEVFEDTDVEILICEL
jgi:O-acetyl-ADP-ribose deacetylase (regulator of RNase III)